MARTPFKSNYKITQLFAVNKDYYKQFGLAGHEGLDIIPQNLSDWSVVALEDGQVVRDVDPPKDGGAYGTFVTLWHPKLKLATQYCHLQLNNVSLGQQVKRGDVIGVMGSTGNTNGAHLHLNLFQVDDNGVRLNTNNGYKGGIDPLILLNESGVSGMQTVDNETFERLVKKSENNDQIAAALVLDANDAELDKKVIKVVDDLKNEVSKKNSEIDEKNKRIAELEAQPAPQPTPIPTPSPTTPPLDSGVKAKLKILIDWIFS